MGLPVYATKQDLTDGEWVPEGEVPDTAGADLRAASVLIRRMTLTARYPADADGAPTDQDTADAMRDATCAQVAWWAETGDRSGAASIYAEASVGSVSLRRSAAGSVPGSARYSPEALDILADAGLIGHRPTTRR